MSEGRTLPKLKLERMRSGTYRQVCNQCKYEYYIKPARIRRILRDLENRTQVLQINQRLNVYPLSISTLDALFAKTKCRANVNLHFRFYIETQTLHRRNANFVSQQQKRFHVITQTLRRGNVFSIKNNDKIEWNYLKSMSSIRQKKKSSKK